jgi:hypothetical protein
MNGLAAAITPSSARAGHAAYYFGSRFVSRTAQKVRTLSTVWQGLILAGSVLCWNVRSTLGLRVTSSFIGAWSTADKKASEHSIAFWSILFWTNVERLAAFEELHLTFCVDRLARRL